MPRPNPPREVLAEANVARRVLDECEARGWSLDGLAQRMTDVGCPIRGSSLHKSLKGNPPRRIVVDELVALSRVFGVPVDELLLPPEIARRERLAPKVLAVVDAWQRAEQANRERTEATQALLQVLGDDADLRGVAVEVFDALAPDIGVNGWLRKIIESAESYGQPLDGGVEVVGYETGPDGRMLIHLEDGTSIEAEGEQ